MSGFKIDAAALRLITSRAKMVVERNTRTAIPILQTVRLEWAKGVLRAEATDLDISIICAADAETDGRGEVAINVDHLNWIARAAEDDMVEVETLPPAVKQGPERIKVSAGEISATMNLINFVDAFPEMVMGDDMQEPITISQPDLHRLLTLGRSAISTEETRYYLNGTFLHGINGKARAVSTDGHRMALIDSEAPWWVVGKKPAWCRELKLKQPEGADPINADYGIIVPAKTVGIIAHLVDPKGNEPVALSISQLRLAATGPNWEVKAKMIDGTYPSYERVIPQEEPQAHMTLALATLRRIAASPFKCGKSGALKFELGNGRAVMSSPDTGDISAPITSTGSFDIGFNSTYLVDTARALGGVVRFDMTKPGDPARVYGEDPNAMFVLMPMRV